MGLDLTVGLNVKGKFDAFELQKLRAGFSDVSKLQRDAASQFKRGLGFLKQGRREAQRTGRSLRDGAFQAARRFDLINRSLTRLRTGIVSLLTGGAIAAGIGFFVRQLQNLNDEFQRSQAVLAGLLSRNFGTGNFEQSIPAARALQQRLFLESARSPGTGAEFVNAFTRVNQSSGLNLQDSITLTRGLLKAGELSRGSFGRENITNDLIQALQGPISARTAQDLATTLRNSGISLDQFNAANQSKRLELIQLAIERQTPVFEALDRTFSTQLSTLRSQLQVFALAGSRRFNELGADSLRGINDFLADNAGGILRTASGFAPTIAGAGVLGGIGALGLGTLTTAVGLLGSLGAVGGGAAGLLGGGGVAAGALGGASALLGGPVVLPVLLGIGAAFAAIAAIGGSLLTFLFAFPLGLQTIGRQFEFVLFQVQEFGFALLQLGATVFEAFRPVLEIIGSGAFTLFVASLSLLARILRFGTDAIGAFITKFQAFGIIVSSLFEAAGRASDGDFLGARTALTSGFGTARGISRQGDIQGQAAVANFLSELQGFSGDDPFNLEDLLRTLNTSGNTTNIGTVEVEIKAETLDDPQRVAVALQQTFREIDRRRQQASGTGIKQVL